MVEEYDYLFKSIVVGDGGVGKTALTLRFSKGFFTEDYKMTIGVDFHVKTIAIETAEGLIKCKLQLWDTGGQERFSSIRPMYYRGSLGTVLVFDLTNSASFEHLPQWIEEVRSNIKADIPILLVGNKSDLIDQRAVSIEEIGNFTRDFNLYYMETSAKTGDGVGDCFYILACLMIGQGVPEQFIANATVFTPGDVPPPPSETASEPTDSYLAPLVPEPIQSFEPEPEIEYEAPPVPEPTATKATEQMPSFEPEPEVEYEAPPVPEPVQTFEPQPEPEISMPEPTEIEFKTPDEILLQKAKKIEPEIRPSIFPESSPVESEVYKPPTIPFSSNSPVPATPPKEFQTDKPETSEVGSSTQTPFRVMKREEPPKPQPASMTFEPVPEPKAEPTSVTPLFQTSKTQPSSSESLIDYMPQTILSKKEMICPKESDYIIFLEGKSPIFLLSKAVITAPRYSIPEEIVEALIEEYEIDQEMIFLRPDKKIETSWFIADVLKDVLDDRYDLTDIDIIYEYPTYGRTIIAKGSLRELSLAKDTIEYSESNKEN